MILGYPRETPIWSADLEPGFAQDFEEMICVTCSDDTTMRIWDRGMWDCWSNLSEAWLGDVESRLFESFWIFLALFSVLWTLYIGELCQHVPTHCQLIEQNLVVSCLVQDLMGRTCIAVLEGHASRVTCLREVLRSFRACPTPHAMLACC